MWNKTQHSYEELRDIVVDILLQREKVQNPPSQLAGLDSAVAEVLKRRETGQMSPISQQLHPNDEQLVRDAFWDLFRQGYVNPGLNAANPNLPFFRLNHRGQKLLGTSSPYRFHDTTSYLSMIKKQVPDIAPETIM